MIIPDTSVRLRWSPIKSPIMLNNDLNTIFRGKLINCELEECWGWNAKVGLHTGVADIVSTTFLVSRHVEHETNLCYQNRACERCFKISSLYQTLCVARDWLVSLVQHVNSKSPVSCALALTPWEVRSSTKHFESLIELSFLFCHWNVLETC